MVKKVYNISIYFVFSLLFILTNFNDKIAISALNNEQCSLKVTKSQTDNEYKVHMDTTYDLINFYDIKSDTIFYRKIRDNLPTLAFYINLKDKSDNKFEYFPIESIIIKDSSNKELLQVIKESDYELGIANIEFDDYNFDGYLDIYLHDACAILANCFGKVFLYSKDTKKFELANEFDDMTSVSADKSKKEVYSYNRCCGGALYTYGVYKFINGKLTLIKEISQDSELSGNKTYYIYKVRELGKNGKMKTVKIKKSKEPILLEEE